MKNILTGFSLLVAVMATAQDSTQQKISVNPLTISGYVEGYYSYDFNKPPNNSRPSFLYNYNRHNEFTADLGFIKIAYATDRVRANLSLAAGTYMNANYAAEPGILKNIFEANTGYKLSVKSNVWLDIGILPSHIGFESATGKDNWNLTRSIVAENSPYFESGARLTYTTRDNKLTIAALALNGWQRITRADGNSLMSYGTQIYFKPSEKLTLNYSTFFGTDKPDSIRLWRIYHNVYGIIQLNDKLGLIAGFDIGTEQKSKGSSAVNTWYSPVGILRYTPSLQWAIALRGEYYNDKNGVIVYTGTPDGFQTTGISLNLDYLPQKNISLRLEVRTFAGKDDTFVKRSSATNQNTDITFSTAISF